MRVVHANWSGGLLHLWAENGDDIRRADAVAPHDGDAVAAHPFALSADDLRALCASLGVATADTQTAGLTLHLPSASGSPLPSAHLAHESGISVTSSMDVSLASWRVPTIGVRAGQAPALLERLESACAAEFRPGAATLGGGAEHLAACARFARSLLAQQRFVPMLAQTATGDVSALWQPWWSDQGVADRMGVLAESMPAIVRAVDDDFRHDAWLLLEDFVTNIGDALCREALNEEQMVEAIEGRVAADPHVAWLEGLLDGISAAGFDSGERPNALRAVRRWIGLLDDRGADVGWRLCLRLSEPLLLDADEEGLTAPDEKVRWRLALLLQSSDEEGALLDAADIWASSADVVNVDGKRVEAPGELLLGELSRAARVYPKLEPAVHETEPTGIDLTTRDAHRFLSEIRPLLLEQGWSVLVPEWWHAPGARLGVRLQIDSPETPANAAESGGDTAGGEGVGLNALVDYSWRLALGDADVSIAQLRQLARGGASLVRINGRWVELRPDDLDAVERFVGDDEGGKMSLGDLIRRAFGADPDEAGVEILGVDATGWVGGLLGAEGQESAFKTVEVPDRFAGELRPYQRTGLSWLAFLEQFGLGGCLADDMGLGKTIQVIALMQHEREEGRPAVGPTLVVAPMSVVGNWRRECNRFAPELVARVHHGLGRSTGDEFVRNCAGVDLIITTYALANRDIEDLCRVQWRRVVLDEAQNVKNPAAKQSQAIRRLTAGSRMALTGTPVENRLSELWSIMDFCNPGYLGGVHEFKRRFSAPIERRHDARRAAQLRKLVQPFVLRRLKSDPRVIADLPPKIESKAYCPLTAEQAGLYEEAVNRMLSEVDQAEGIRRRGVVLATLVKLKQICNHPQQATGEASSGVPDPSRSGKTVRIVEMLDEVVAAGDSALVFTQFREMGNILVSLLAHELDRDILFLHGGTPQKAREDMVDRFQRSDGTAPIFVLSLKAGGVGMNLTAASHVFHFDRWWNPAVENQATDRAYRIGQTRTVQVHKFVVAGTLEERIDEMIEQKTELAENIIGSGENWLTELSTSQLRDLLTLRREALV